MLKLFFKQRIGIFYTLRDLVKGRKKLRDCFSTAPFDVTFLALVISLLTVGLVMMFSASYIYAWYDKSAAYDPYYYIKKQVVFAIIGVILMIAVSFVNPDIFRDASGVIMAIALLLLVVVLINPFEVAGKEEFKRWLYIPVIGSFQPRDITNIMKKAV